jgi:hypothetical protein
VARRDADSLSFYIRATVWLQLEVKAQYFWASLVGGLSDAPRLPSMATSDNCIRITVLGRADDGMPETRAMTVAFLDEVMPINGPLLLIPKNHK